MAQKTCKGPQIPCAYGEVTGTGLYDLTAYNYFVEHYANGNDDFVEHYAKGNIDFVEHYANGKGSQPVPFFLFFYKVYKRPLTPPPCFIKLRCEFFSTF